MGCGRSRQSSPTLTANDGIGNKENRRGGKRQKLAGKSGNKSSKRELVTTDTTPTKTTNGKMGGVKTEWQVGGLQSDGKEGAAKRDWQLEEAVDTPPETVMAVYRSSVPASARSSLQASPVRSLPTPNINGSLLNGAHKASPLSQDVEMPEETPKKASLKDKTSTTVSNAKPVHITNSQVEFFKMLDEKIERGPDYFTEDD